MKIALIQINPHIGNFSSNCAKIEDWADKARQQGCDLAIFPELAISGYPPQDLLDRPSFIADHEKALAGLVEKIKDIGVICGAITRHTATTGKYLHNSGVLFENGEILFSTHKRLLPSYDVFDEVRYFEPGQKATTFEFRGLNIALTICEDIWNDKDAAKRQIYNLDPVAELLAAPPKPVDLIINLAASPFRIGKAAIKQKIFSTICNKYNLPLLYINQVGGQDSLLFEGHSLAVNRQGKITAQAAGFKEDLLVINTEEIDNNPPITPSKDEMTAVHQALVMGIKDYVYKCGFSKGIIGLSGGIDSALTAALACEALGPKNILGVALPSPYSSKESLEDARQLAANLDINFEVIPIKDIFESNLQTLKPLIGELHQDITEQNIQARIRGNLLMALSNRLGYMLLSTGNKSEIAVGYCTLYGDMSGGLAVISDVPKEMVYKLAHLINRQQEIIPGRTIKKAPSAELAPNQKDQDDLPPYEILDPILKAYLEENLSIMEIVNLGFAKEIVRDVVRRIKFNEYKRKQAPLGLKVTSKAFGYGRRYPTAEKYQEES
ncbi:MAG: NAD+ synthase [Proteobacteria bacterium]|nr:NAD+ synthase [Pseudomonadota bacterium]MBU1716168.1 NAD+ synthase [Pseudomonadota bacterium]